MRGGVLAALRRYGIYVYIEIETLIYIYIYIYECTYTVYILSWPLLGGSLETGEEQRRDWRRCSRGPRVNNGVGDAVVHSSRGRDKGCDGGWGWRGGQAGVDRCVVEANKFWPFVEGRLLGTRSSREYVGISITRNLTHLYYAGS